MFMGGEYLPDLLPDEVEIARATLKSTTMDVISVRARPTKHRIIYRIVDEYYDENLFHYHLIQKTSIRPLTMRQLIALIDLNQDQYIQVLDLETDHLLAIIGLETGKGFVLKRVFKYS